MIGMIMTEEELLEIEYLLERELDELLKALNNQSMKMNLRRAMEERYRILVKSFIKVSSPSKKLQYNSKLRAKNISIKN